MPDDRDDAERSGEAAELRITLSDGAEPAPPPGRLCELAKAVATGLLEPHEHVVTQLKWQLIRRFLIFGLLALGAVAVHYASSDSRGLLFAARHGAFAFLAVVSAGVFGFLVPALSLAVFWLLTYLAGHRKKRRGELKRYLHRWLTLSNRFVMHVSTAMALVFYLIAVMDHFLLCAVLVLAYLLVVPTIVQIGSLRLFQGSWGRRLTKRERLELGEVIYVEHLFFPIVLAVFFALLMLQSSSSTGIASLTVLVVALVLFHLVFFAVWVRFSLRREMDDKERSERAEHRKKIARAAGWDGLVVAGALSAFAMFPFISFIPASTTARAALAARMGYESTENECLDLSELNDAEVAIFLVSDNQFRALHGDTIAHAPLVSALVSVALRPVELDLLSVAAIDHFARVYRDIQGYTKANMPNLELRWAHLGDFGDLACRSELARLDGRAACFGHDTMAGLAPGNHDSHFTGNFGWHPDWSNLRACRGDGPVTHSDDLVPLLHRALRPCAPIIDRSPEEGDFFASAADLGTVGPTPVIGLFVDTSDFAGFSFGAAGVQGEITRAQKLWLIEAMGDTSLVLLFMHHPYEELSTVGQSRIDDIAQVAGNRLLAIVAGHTHQSQYRLPVIADRSVPEFIVGSTTDPPQEAALLTIRKGTRGATARLRFQTIPAVARTDQGCQPPAITAATCESILDEIERFCECRPLFPSVEGTCEHPNPTSQGDVVTADLDPLEAQQRRVDNRARALFDCTERVAGDAVEHWTSRFVDPPTRERDPYRGFRDDCSDRGDPSNSTRRHEELVCLGWVASILQGLEEREGWTFERARRVAFERLAASGAWRVDYPSE